MPELIRYTFGRSSLGDFLAATSALGLVAFEFGDRHAALTDALRLRFPDATIEEDEAGLAETTGQLAAVIDQPNRALPLMLDPRGTDYQKRVWQVLREIPAGQTTTYSAVAARLGTPRDAREATEAIAANTIAILIPCHRVVKKDGSLSGYRWGVRRKRALLSREQTASAFRLT